MDTTYAYVSNVSCILMQFRAGQTLAATDLLSTSLRSGIVSVNHWGS